MIPVMYSEPRIEYDMLSQDTARMSIYRDCKAFRPVTFSAVSPTGRRSEVLAGPALEALIRPVVEVSTGLAARVATWVKDQPLLYHFLISISNHHILTRAQSQHQVLEQILPAIPYFHHNEAIVFRNT